MLLPWQMMLPYIIVVDVVTTEEDATSSITARWQMLCHMMLWYMLKPHELQVSTSCLAGVICQVADGIATVGWMCVGRCYHQVADGTAKDLFNLLSVLRC